MKQGYILLVDKLQGEYKETFSQVEAYGSYKRIDSDTSADMLMELLDQMLEAQNAGRPVTDIVGNNIQEFNRNFYSEYTMVDRFTAMCKTMYRLMWIIFLFTAADLFFSGRNGSGFLQSDIAPFITGGIYGAIFAPILYGIVLKILNSFIKVNDTVQGIVSVIIMVSVLVVAVMLADRFVIYIPSTVVLGVSVCYIVVYIIVCSICNYKRYGSARTPKQEEIRFWDTVNGELVEDVMIGEWQKQFVKKNEQLKKKGKTLMTEDAFLAKLDKQFDSKRGGLINALTFWGTTFVAVILLSIFGEYESWIDYTLFLAIVMGVEVSVYYGFHKVQKSSAVRYAEMRRKMREQGITMMELNVKQKENK